MTIDNSIGFYPSKSQIAPVWTWQVATTLLPNPSPPPPAPGSFITSDVFSVAALSNPHAATYPNQAWCLGYMFIYAWTYEDLSGGYCAAHLEGRFPTGTGNWWTFHTIDEFSWIVPPAMPHLNPWAIPRLPCVPQFRIYIYNGHTTETRWIEGTFSIVTR